MDNNEIDELRCELLSFCIFVIGHNSLKEECLRDIVVVNCFLFVSLS